jgi:thioester reductase-like protein
VVRFANEIKAGCFHHVSSIAAAGLFEGIFREDMFDEAENLDHPYFATKHDSEKVVRTECKVPFRVYRPARGGRFATGEMDKIDGPYYFFKLIQRMRQMLPPWMPTIGIEGGRINIVPVDFVVAAMDHIAHAKGHDGAASTWSTRIRCGSATCSIPSRGRACAGDDPARQRGAARFHPARREEEPDGADAGAPHPQTR